MQTACLLLCRVHTAHLVCRCPYSDQYRIYDLSVVCVFVWAVMAAVASGVPLALELYCAQICHSFVRKVRHRKHLLTNAVTAAVQAGCIQVWKVVAGCFLQHLERSHGVLSLLCDSPCNYLDSIEVPELCTASRNPFL